MSLAVAFEQFRPVVEAAPDERVAQIAGEAFSACAAGVATEQERAAHGIAGGRPEYDQLARWVWTRLQTATCHRVPARVATRIDDPARALSRLDRPWRAAQSLLLVPLDTMDRSIGLVDSGDAELLSAVLVCGVGESLVCTPLVASDGAPRLGLWLPPVAATDVGDELVFALDEHALAHPAQTPGLTGLSVQLVPLLAALLPHVSQILRQQR